MNIIWLRKPDRVAHAFQETNSPVGVASLCGRQLHTLDNDHEWLKTKKADHDGNCKVCERRASAPQANLFAGVE